MLRRAARLASHDGAWRTRRLTQTSSPANTGGLGTTQISTRLSWTPCTWRSSACPRCPGSSAS
eukprot:6024409-Pleurochrysis_carterae.AAC.2